VLFVRAIRPEDGIIVATRFFSPRPWGEREEDFRFKIADCRLKDSFFKS
jgi:hypothetical protein